MKAQNSSDLEKRWNKTQREIEFGKDPKKKEILKQILIKLTKQIQGYEKNLIQLRDMEEEYLQQMHADAELDTTGL